MMPRASLSVIHFEFRRIRSPAVDRARRLYFTMLGVALALFGASIGPTEFGSTKELVRFGVLVATVGAGAATWGTAVMIASVYRVVWPLVLSTATVVAGVVAIAIWWTSAR